MSLPESKIFTQIIPSVVLGLSVISGTLILKACFLQFRKMERTVEVRSLAEKDVIPDQARLTVPLVVLGNELKVTQKTIADQLERVRVSLTENGFDEKEIQVGAPQVTDNESGNFYGTQKPKFRFSLRATLSVSTRKMDSIEKFKISQTERGQDGIVVDNSNVQYYFTDLNSVKPAMLADATKNARETAEKFSNDSNAIFRKS